MFSLAVLIGRGLDLNGLVLLIQPFTSLYSVLKVRVHSKLTAISFEVAVFYFI